mmetsp:Transcript_31500/g.63989  ORF Transcript_31500/g.63989 Transcript_31500/m.63989 type:complete len:296 (+) Transcript_31500:1363-2250(+)
MPGRNTVQGIFRCERTSNPGLAVSLNDTSMWNEGSYMISALVPLWKRGGGWFGWWCGRYRWCSHPKWCAMLLLEFILKEDGVEVKLLSPAPDFSTKFLWVSLCLCEYFIAVRNPWTLMAFPSTVSEMSSSTSIPLPRTPALDPRLDATCTLTCDALRDTPGRVMMWFSSWRQYAANLSRSAPASYLCFRLSISCFPMDGLEGSLNTSIIALAVWAPFMRFSTASCKGLEWSMCPRSTTLTRSRNRRDTFPECVMYLRPWLSDFMLMRQLCCPPSPSILMKCLPALSFRIKRQNSA